MTPWLKQLKSYIESVNQAYVSTRTNGETLFIRDEDEERFNRKQKQLQERSAEVLKASVHGRVTKTQKLNDIRQVDYFVHHEYFIRQGKKYYIEEHTEKRKAIFHSDKLVDEYSVGEKKNQIEERPSIVRDTVRTGQRYKYSRLEAVKYAERWWNDSNPQYKNFEDNCTNFISQCLRAGGAPMTGFPNRSKGWWYKDHNWSYSWTVAHSFRWYLSGATSGLRARSVSKPEELIKGDVICYDFNGDGRWQHTTIVVDKDANNMPLVNAQTTNSRMRYWAYEDSTAWTPNIKYMFFHIIDG